MFMVSPLSPHTLDDPPNLGVAQLIKAILPESEKKATARRCPIGFVRSSTALRSQPRLGKNASILPHETILQHGSRIFTGASSAPNQEVGGHHGGTDQFSSHCATS